MLAICIEGFKATSPIKCHYLYATDEYQAWMLGYWLWITGEARPRTILQKTDCLWLVNGFTVQWDGVYEEGTNHEVRDRKKEFIRLD